MFSMVQTGDKSSEVTARMNLSDLRLVVGLKSNYNIHPSIFQNTNTNSSSLPVSYQGYPNLQGKLWIICSSHINDKSIVAIIFIKTNVAAF